MQRQVVLDTETTGLRVEDGHRIIEIGCVEIIDRRLSGRHFHYYLNPEKEIEAGATAIHGLTNDFLADKPYFHHICDEFISFISNCELIIHNAAFDLGFLDYELKLTNRDLRRIMDYCSVLDTLHMARKLHAGRGNSLDALCKRYRVDHSKREFHGALLDAHLLAQVYLAMTGGQSSFFEISSNAVVNGAAQVTETVRHLTQKFMLPVIKATTDELAAHEKYLKDMKASVKCLWLEEAIAE